LASLEGTENLVSTRIRSPDGPARSKSLPYTVLSRGKLIVTFYNWLQLTTVCVSANYQTHTEDRRSQ